jgi:hypothetical protein
VAAAMAARDGLPILFWFPYRTLFWFPCSAWEPIFRDVSRRAGQRGALRAVRSHAEHGNEAVYRLPLILPSRRHAQSPAPGLDPPQHLPHRLHWVGVDRLEPMRIIRISAHRHLAVEAEELLVVPP